MFELDSKLTCNVSILRTRKIEVRNLHLGKPNEMNSKAGYDFVIANMVFL